MKIAHVALAGLAFVLANGAAAQTRGSASSNGIRYTGIQKGEVGEAS